MARRRYITTSMAHDQRLNEVALRHGDFPVLLYTWLIPHAEDDGTIKGTPGEIRVQVVPWRHDRTDADIEAALEALAEAGLLEWDRQRHIVGFPPESFYRYQTYIRLEKRRSVPLARYEPTRRRGTRASGAADQRTSPEDAAQQRTAPRNTEHQRTTAKNAVSPSPSPTPSPPVLPPEETIVSSSGRTSARLQRAPVPSAGDQAEREPDPSRRTRQPSVEYPPEFEAAYQAYPRHIAKRRALHAWHARLKERLDDGTRITAELLHQAAEHYAAHCAAERTPKRYQMYPSTFWGPDHRFADFLQRARDSPQAQVDGPLRRRPVFLKHPAAFPELEVVGDAERAG